MCCKKTPGLVVIKVKVTGSFVILLAPIIVLTKTVLSGVFCMVSGHVTPVDELTELLKTYWQSVFILLAFKLKTSF
ncbi:hypothetical protein BDF21DRAFT_429448, partial [Thamnidium elegans]